MAQAETDAGPWLPFWKNLREAWDQVLVGDRPFLERPFAPGQPSRYGKVHSLDKEKHNQLQARVKEMTGQKFPSVQQHRRVYKRVFLGKGLLGKVDSPQFKNGFTYQFITGEPDTNKGWWYGLVRVMRDPQKWSNKWLVQAMHIMNTNAKGGIMAETDAF